MTLPANNEFANRELSIDELDAIAGGNFLGDVWNKIESGAHAVTSEVKSIFGNPAWASVAAGIIIVGGIVTGGSALKAK
jgi:hypothetical protein